MNTIGLVTAAQAQVSQAIPVLPQPVTASANGEFSLPQTALAGRVQSAKNVEHDKLHESDNSAQLQLLMGVLLNEPAPSAVPLRDPAREKAAAPLLQALAQVPVPLRSQPLRAHPDAGNMPHGHAGTATPEPRALPPELQAALATLTVSAPQESGTPVQLAKQLMQSVQDPRAIAPQAPERADARRELAIPAASRIHAADPDRREKLAATPVLANTTFIERRTTQEVAPANAAVAVGVDARAADFGEKLSSILKESIHFQIGQQQQTSTIRLDPPSLGKLDIAIQLDAGKLIVHINASQADVCHALQQLSDNLRTQLTQQNFVQVDVQVSADGQSQQQREGQEHRQQPQIISAKELNGGPDVQEHNDSVLIKV